MTTRPGISPTDWITLARYVSGEARPDERASLDARAAADPAFAQLMSESLVGWTVAGVTPLQRDKQAAWTAIEARSSRATGHPNGPGRVRFKTQPLRRGVWSTLVGATLAVLTLVVGWHVGFLRHGARTGVPVSAYVTGNGERANITLPDGNTVALDVASRLDVPVDYLNGNHTLRLHTGEALFTITHQTGTPLTVLTDSAAVRVLGTRFLVRHYASDSAATVAVQQGRVAVRSTVLSANQETMVSRAGVAPIRVASPGLFSFITGVLTLEDLPLPAAISELDRWYDADIRLGTPALATQHVKGKFVMGSLADLSSILELTFNVRVVRDGRVLTLYLR